MGNMARHQKGQVLRLTLIVLTIGAIIVVGLSLYPNTGLSAYEKSAERILTYYAADSGFEDAIFWLQQDMDLVGWYEIEEGQWEHAYIINNRNVDVIVEDTGNQVYKITSTATTDSGHGTIIESYVFIPETTPLSNDNAIASSDEESLDILTYNIID